MGLLKNIFVVLIGRKTWVGYNKTGKEKIDKLPDLKRSVISITGTMNAEIVDKNAIHKLNLLYCANYSLMNDFGADMGNLFYDGISVIFDTAYFPKALPGEYIICDIQNAYYDKDELRKNFEAAGLKFVVITEENAVEIRKIFDGKNLIEEISISQNEVKIQNFLRGYSYQLVNAEDF